MKITISAARLPPAHDGVGDHADMIARCLAARGHDVVMIAAGEASPPASYRLELSGSRWGVLGTLRAVACLAAERADALIVEYTPFLYGSRSFAPLVLLVAARVLGVPTALVVHEALYGASSDAAGKSRVKATILAMRDRTVMRLARNVIVPSRARAQATLQALPALRRRLHVVPIGANVEPGPGYLRRPSSPATIVAFGVVVVRRRLERAVDAVAMLSARGRNVRLQIIGRIHDPAYAARVTARAVAAGIGDRVAFVGELTPSQLTSALAGAAGALHAPQEGAVESSGSLLALLAHGVPTVAVRTVHDDAVFNGALRFADDDTAAVTAALVDVLDALEKPAVPAAPGTELYRSRFAWDNAADGILAALKKEHADVRYAPA